MDVAITGSHGLIGSALADALRLDGHRVVRVVRGATSGPGEVAWDPEAGTIDAAALEGVDAVVHLAGAGIGDHRWTDEHKRRVKESRTRGTATLTKALAAMERKPAVLLSGSAIGYYGSRGDEILTEVSAPGNDFLAEVCVAWEAGTAPAADAGIRVVLLRTGLVLDGRGGMMSKMLPLFKLGLGGRMGSGRQWWSWISIEDEVGAIRFLLERDVAGAVNLTAPEPVTNAEFTRTLGRVLHRPTPLPVPMFGPALLLGREGAATMINASQRVHPEKLLAEGYQFRHVHLESALRTATGRGEEVA
jgi:uncharacterized protein (TIGR01777 family)